MLRIGGEIGAAGAHAVARELAEELGGDDFAFEPDRAAVVCGAESSEIRMANAWRNVTIGALSSLRGPASVSRTLFGDAAESRVRRQRLAAAQRRVTEPATAIQGWPSKREGRTLQRLRCAAA